MAYTDLHAPSVTFRLECHPPAPDDDLACVGRSNTQAWVAIYSATARVEDPAPPAVEPLNRLARLAQRLRAPLGRRERCERRQVAECVGGGDEAVRQAAGV